MYDLTWARQVVENSAVLWTRPQQSEAEFEAFCRSYAPQGPVYSLKDALTWALALSDMNTEAAVAWNRAKAALKRPPGRGKCPDTVLLSLYRAAHYRIRWRQEDLF